MLEAKLTEAIKVLKEGGIVIYPTDTAFGIGCRMDDSISVERLFKIRKRPVSQAAPVLVNSIDMAQKYLLSPLPDNVRRLCDAYWPGGLTVIYHCRIENVPPLVRGGGTTLGVRMPDHEIPLALIHEVGVPLLGPSANFHGEKTPYRYTDLDKDLIKLADFVIEGKCKGGLASTVVDCTKNPFQVVRNGAVKVNV